MKLKDVEVGSRYRAKVSNNLTVVRVHSIVKQDGKTRIYAVNEATGREIVLRSAQRLRSKVT